MIKQVGYDPKYAEWLPKNLQRLKENSIKLLESDGRDSAEFVRYSIIVNFDYTKDLKRFKAYVISGTKGNSTDRKSFIDTAIELTDDSGASVDLKSLY